MPFVRIKALRGATKMAAKIPRYNPPDPDKLETLDAFEESRAWALNWDGPALHAPKNIPMQPLSTGPKPKQNARP